MIIVFQVLMCMAVPIILIGVLIAIALSNKPESESYIIPYQPYEQNVTYNIYNNCYIVQQHGQTINYELPANNYVSEFQLRERLCQTNYRCEECGNLYPMYDIRVEPANRRLLCMSCGLERL